MSNKRDLLDSDVDSDGSDDGGLTLTVNKRYAQAYDDRKRKQELSRARDLGLLDGDEGEASPSSDITLCFHAFVSMKNVE